MENQTIQKKYIFQVHGMHCNACTLLVESEISELKNVESVRSDLKHNSVEVVGDFGEKTPKQIADELTIPLKAHGYTISVEKEIKQKNW
ncbi:MAG: heavy-metal-associated domain-containing protein [bacterium]